MTGTSRPTEAKPGAMGELKQDPGQLEDEIERLGRRCFRTDVSEADRGAQITPPAASRTSKMAK
ncbi:hypothetical protein CTA1_9206 [Colletotrichum tanaceti]|uniref:Uncharacterized protein n=1 Tax=Colletotrichum tanaceti TaxID=1306861 RepID=A0A4U6XFE3_9PEZI|nr:hypothetical protein CTA1_9206 [Colletotrichum tanaceti]